MFFSLFCDQDAGSKLQIGEDSWELNFLGKEQISVRVDLVLLLLPYETQPKLLANLISRHYQLILFPFVMHFQVPRQGYEHVLKNETQLLTAFPHQNRIFIFCSLFPNHPQTNVQWSRFFPSFNGAFVVSLRESFKHLT